MTATEIRQRTARAIDDLGHDPDTIADRLRQLGITGIRKHDCRCVLAVYLHRVLGDEAVIEVLETTVTVHLSADPTGPIVEIPLPGHVTRFIRNFDRGDYPDLIEVA